MDPSSVGFSTSRAPKIAPLYEHLLVTGVGPNGRVVYSRRDPNRPGTIWLDAGTAIDQAIVGAFTDFDVLSFNSDLYLAGSKVVGVGWPAGAYVINFSRAAMRQLVTGKWGMDLLWGGPGGAGVKGAGGFAAPDEIPASGTSTTTVSTIWSSSRRKRNQAWVRPPCMFRSTTTARLATTRYGTSSSR
jgi:hypothetical protein